MILNDLNVISIDLKKNTYEQGEEQIYLRGMKLKKRVKNTHLKIKLYSFPSVQIACIP